MSGGPSCGESMLPSEVRFLEYILIKRRSLRTHDKTPSVLELLIVFATPRLQNQSRVKVSVMPLSHATNGKTIKTP